MTPAGWAAAAAVGGAAAALLARRLAADPGLPVLRWHLVGPILPGSALNDLRVPMSAFEEQVRHLARRRFRPVTLAEALARRGDRAFLRERPVALTFDGPSASFLGHAWPALKRHGLARCTLFFPPARLGQATLQVPEGRPEPLLSPAQLAALAAEGVALGVQVGPHDAAEELRRGAELLGSLQGAPVQVAALPPGAQRDRVLRAAVRAAGFTGAAFAGGGRLRRRTSRLLVPRFAVRPDTPLLDLAMFVSRPA